MGVGAGWYYDSLDGMVVHQNLAESLANALFSYYHGPYPTEAAAIAHRGVSGPPGSTNESAGQQIAAATGNAAGGLLGLPSFGSAGWRSYGLRALKIVTGVILIIVGLVQLTHAQQIVAAAAPIAKAVA